MDESQTEAGQALADEGCLRCFPGGDEVKIIVTGRRGGKTTAMLQWLREAPEGEHRVLVCHSEMEAMRLWREVWHKQTADRPDREMQPGDLESWQFVGPLEMRGEGVWSGVLMGRSGRVVLGFDNLDLWLQGLTHFEVGAASLTSEDAPQETT
jgi:hypothetical protein